MCGISTCVSFPLMDEVKTSLAEAWNRRSVDPVIQDFMEKFRDHQPDNQKSNRALRIAYAKAQQLLKL